MGKLALLGAALLGFGGHPAHHPITRAEAVQAIHAADYGVEFNGQQVMACAPNAKGTTCLVQAARCYDDQAFGPSLLVASTTVQVSRVRNRYVVRIVIPVRFDVYACN